MKILLLSILFFSTTLQAQIVEKTLATVEGEMVSLLDLKEARMRLNRGFLNDSTLLILFKKSQLKKNDSALLNFLIYEKLLDISVQNSSFKINSRQIRKELNKKRKETKLSKKKFSRYLVKSQFTSTSYQKFLKNNLLRGMVIQKEIMEKIRITDQELNEYAKKRQGRGLFTSFKYDLAYLQFPQTKAGKKQAQKALQTLSKDSALFDKWTTQKGERKETLKNIKLSGMNPIIRSAVKKLSYGQISPILELPTGPTIFKILWKEAIITAKNQKRKEKLGKSLFQELLSKNLKIWLEDLRKQAFIQINS